MSMFRLDGKVAIVTGAARGLGAVTTEILAKQGATVVTADIDFEGAISVVNGLASESKAYEVDVSKNDELPTFVDDVKDFGRIDIVVNNAGICPLLPFVTSTEEDWENLMGINVRSQFFLMQAACAVMKGQAGGRIVNVVSTSGLTGSFANASIYAGTKGAIVMFTKSVAREVAADNILVNCVAPGVMDTGMIAICRKQPKTPSASKFPFKRVGNPEEIAACIAYLASDECSYTTGATFDINGGWDLR